VAPPGTEPRKKETGAALAETQAWEAAGLHCSANERRADEASRDVEAWLKCKYMREHLGEEFGGVVSSATSFGIFVTLDAMYVEGLVHITELGGEYFKFDEARQELRGERSGIRYAIGYARARAGQPGGSGRPAHRFSSCERRRDRSAARSRQIQTESFLADQSAFGEGKGTRNTPLRRSAGLPGPPLQLCRFALISGAACAGGISARAYF
jgi:hypothetical protein